MKPRYQLPNEVLKAARDLGIDDHEFSMVSADKWQDIQHRVFAKFHSTQRYYLGNLLWDGPLSDVVACMTVKDGPGSLATMLGAEWQVWLLTEDYWGCKREGGFWIFEGRLGAVARVLAGFDIEYAIVDRKLGWMVCENHNSNDPILKAAGEPAVSRMMATGLAAYR